MKQSVTISNQALQSCVTVGVAWLGMSNRTTAQKYSLGSREWWKSWLDCVAAMSVSALLPRYVRQMVCIVLQEAVTIAVGLNDQAVVGIT